MLELSQTTSHEKTVGYTAASSVCFYIFAVLLISLLLRHWPGSGANIRFDKFYLKFIDILITMVGLISGIAGLASDNYRALIASNIILIPFIVFLLSTFPIIAMISVARLFGQRGQPPQRRPQVGGWSKGIFIVFVFVYLIFAIIYLALSLQ
ncbi:MAG: hypothetical protein ACFFD2_04245 [Promethearchaeota archaeon]